jgi:hypothetical protein
MKKLIVALLLLPVAVLAQQYAEVVRTEPRMVTIQQSQCQEIAVRLDQSQLATSIKRRRYRCTQVPVTEQRGEIVTFQYNGKTFTQTFE